MQLKIKKIFITTIFLIIGSILPDHSFATAKLRKGIQNENNNSALCPVYSKKDKVTQYKSYKRKQSLLRGLWMLSLFTVGNYSSLYYSPFSLTQIKSDNFNRTLLNFDQKNDSIAVVIRTWSEDAKTALVAAESALDQVNHLSELVIVTDQKSVDAVEQDLVGPLKELYGDKKKIKFIVEDSFLINGHIQQKYSKMMADKYTDAKYIAHLDSDAAITEWEDNCFLRDGKPINDYDLWDNLPDSVRQWRTGTAFLLGEEVNHEYSRVNQHVYPRELYKKIRDEIESIHGVSFKEMFTKYNLVGTGSDLRKVLNSTLISDFNAMGAFAHLKFPDLMYQLDLSTGEEWRKICTTQCNSRRWSNTCCDSFRREQIENAKNNVPIKAHLICSDYKEGHPCECINEKNGNTKKKRSLISQTNEVVKETHYFEPCNTSTNTAGFKCDNGYCYGSAIEDTCEKIINWFDQQKDRGQYPSCKCP